MIEEIGIDINEVSIPDIRVYQPPGWTTNPNAIFVAPPVTQEVGVPVVDMPGCVEAHEQNTSKEKSGVLGDDDPKGVKVYCDAGVPSFNPIEFTPEEVIPTRPAKLPPYKKPEEPPKPPQQVSLPKIPEVNTVNCLPDETYNVQLRKCEKNIIEVPSEPEIPWHEEYLPATGVMVQTSIIATAAAGAALAAKPIATIVLKGIKPAVKQVVNKIAKILGKHQKEVVKSVFERRMEQKHLRG